MIKAITDQANKLVHYSNTDFYYSASIDLAELLAKIVPGDYPKKVFFGNSGTEANEAALKLVRYNSRRPRILAFNRSFHGRTMGSLSLTASKAAQRLHFFPLIPGVTHIPYPYCFRCPFKLEYPGCDLWCVDYIDEEVLQTHTPAEEVGCLIAEPIQGEGGYVVPPQDYFLRLQRILKKYEIRLIVDEVQSGMGRTGKWCAIENFKVIPDVVTMAKALGGGLPLGAMVAPSKMHTWGSGAHASTFGGNPVACQAAIAVIEEIKRGKLMENAVNQGEYIKKRFLELQATNELIGDVRGIGLMIGVELVEDPRTKRPAVKTAQVFMNECLKNGLAVILAGLSTIRICPPLVINRPTLEVAFDVMANILNKIK